MNFIVENAFTVIDNEINCFRKYKLPRVVVVNKLIYYEVKNNSVLSHYTS